MIHHRKKYIEPQDEIELEQIKQELEEKRIDWTPDFSDTE
jgi:hypothetical protein